MMVKSTCAWMVFVGIVFILAHAASAADPELSPLAGKPPAAVEMAVQVAAKAAQHQTSPDLSILIILQPHPSVEKIPAVQLSARLAHCRRLLKDALETAALKPIVSNDISAEFADKLSDGYLLPKDVPVLQLRSGCDAVLHAIYKKTENDELLLLALIDEDRRYWSRTVSLTPPKVLVAKSTPGKGVGPSPFGGAGFGMGPGMGTGPGGSPAGMSVAGVSGAGAVAGGSAGEGAGRAAREGAAEGIDADNLAPLNLRVLTFALEQLGRQVGNGECWTLAAEALRAAGARQANGFNFGQQVALNQIEPGDILQFRSARFQTGIGFYIFGAPDHTVVVKSVQGTQVTILHQNFGRRIVTELTIDFQTMTAGSVTAWRPVEF